MTVPLLHKGHWNALQALRLSPNGATPTIVAQRLWPRRWDVAVDRRDELCAKAARNIDGLIAHGYAESTSAGVVVTGSGLEYARAAASYWIGERA